MAAARIRVDLTRARALRRERERQRGAASPPTGAVSARAMRPSPLRSLTIRSLDPRPITTTPKQQDYEHGPHSMNFQDWPGRKRKVATWILGIVVTGTAVPLVAVAYQQSKLKA
jgi:hypothetical protein